MVRVNVGKLESLAELRRSISGHDVNGGVELTDYSAANVNAAILTVNIAKDWRHLSIFERTYTSTSYNLTSNMRVFSTGYVNFGAYLRTFHSGVVDLNAFLRPLLFSSLDLLAEITAEANDTHEYTNISATLNSFQYKDIAASISSILPLDLNAILSPIGPANLGAILGPVPPADLHAYAGAHPPADLLARVSITQPVLFPAYIRAAARGELDLNATITRIGEYVEFPARINTLSHNYYDLHTTLIIRTPKDLRGIIQTYHIEDLSASIQTQRIKDLRAIISGWVREAVSDLRVYLKLTSKQVLDLPVSPLKAIVHTNSNLQAILNSAPFIIYDLMAAITGTTNLSKDLTGSATAVAPVLNINKLIVNFVPSKNLNAEITSRGSYLNLRALIKPSNTTSTGTSPGAGYRTIANTYRFYLGTNKGLFIAPEIKSSIKTNYYINEHPSPDLNGYIQGWYSSDMGAYISWYPYTVMTASLSALDLNHISNMRAIVSPTRIYNLTASITRVGYYTALGAALTPSGGYRDLSAIIVPYINVISLLTLPVSTKPFFSLNASINFSSEFGCGGSSAFKEMNAFIRVLLRDTLSVNDMPATLNSRSLKKDLAAEITGRKRTRIRTITFGFRSKTRNTETLNAFITPLRMAEISLAAEIYGKSHETDLTAQLTTIRLAPTKIVYKSFETLVNLAHPEDLKRVMLSFRSQVSSYVYDEIVNSVFSTDRGTWGIDLRTVINKQSFFDSSDEVRIRELSNISEFYSIDEAIRNALVLLCEKVNTNIPAELTVAGASRNLNAFLNISPADKINNLSAKIVSVLTNPDLTAEINTGIGSSSFGMLMASLNSHNPTTTNLNAEVVGNISSDFSASLTVI